MSLSFVHDANQTYQNKHGTIKGTRIYSFSVHIC